ncbi:transporter substrate-binding domain-containing protein [Cellulomonas sp. JZ18]|uniref:transporter substrate-binding domain-containing protein n=1 Tax=Cellulomonas sp. JZ18 TaxID=2654191 RepID=UPI0012D452BD|nr:transporter substrate-binding domain-containing protein [Cellulomonas sp. JZ18]QGQ19294.1 transporter substrate-binding domain-containing protein [Cellulomonas sp. JZ18]
MRRTTALVSAVLVVLTAGCGVTVPTDPEGTLERVRGGQLRVGVTVREPWTSLPDGDDAPPEGREVDLVVAFAEHLDAEVEWQVGSEEQLVAALEEGDVEMLVGGLTASSPWSSRVALTRPYVTVPDEHGDEENHVMATRAGENAFLVELERFLVAQDVQQDVGGLP